MSTPTRSAERPGPPEPSDTARDDLPQWRPPHPPKSEHFISRLRSPAVAARVGVPLGIAFGICFLTGLLSHYAQNTDHPIPYPTSPSWGYRVTQGLHVTSGTAAIPLLLVKLWSVYPKLFDTPEVGRTLRHARAAFVALLEKASIGVLVASAILQLVSGLMNTAQWYPWHFAFRETHYALAWVVIGSLVVHIAVKLPIIRDVLGADVETTVHDRPTAGVAGPLTRRGLLRTAWLASGVAVVTTAGSTVPLLRHVSVFGVRSGSDHHGGPPINRSAQAAHITDAMVGADYRFTVAVGDQETSLTLEDLQGMEQHTVTLPIACVEGWSASADWTGVRVRDLVARAGGSSGREVVVLSLQPSGGYRSSTLQSNFADDDRTLIALKVNGEALSRDHGYPARVIAPDRPGVLQTKWVHRLEVSA